MSSNTAATSTSAIPPEKKKTRKQAKQLAKEPKKSNTGAADPSAGPSTELDF
jgi:hypothetical protein